jgi:hypothetical protein
MTLKHPTLTDSLNEVTIWADTQELEILRADAAITIMKELQNALPKLRRIRVSAMRALQESGWTDSDIARELDISRARVYQLKYDPEPIGTVDESEM